MPNTDRAQKALDTYRAESATRDDGWDGKSPREALSDLLADLLHLADQQVADGDDDAQGGHDVLITARNNYEEEQLVATAS